MASCCQPGSIFVSRHPPQMLLTASSSSLSILQHQSHNAKVYLRRCRHQWPHSRLVICHPCVGSTYSPSCMSTPGSIPFPSTSRRQQPFDNTTSLLPPTALASSRHVPGASTLHSHRETPRSGPAFSLSGAARMLARSCVSTSRSRTRSRAACRHSSLFPPTYSTRSSPH